MRECDEEFGEHDHDDAECGRILDTMRAGYDDYDPREDMYWSGTGELMSDDSYIDYLNRN